MERKVFIYNDALDSIALDQLSQLEGDTHQSFDEPTYIRRELDERDREILIDCLEAGYEAYDNDGDKDGAERLIRMIAMFQEV